MACHNYNDNVDQDGDDYNLTFAMSFIPLARSGAMLDYYGEYYIFFFDDNDDDDDDDSDNDDDGNSDDDDDDDWIMKRTLAGIFFSL